MGEQWYCLIVGQEVGPVTSEDLVSMLSRGQIDPDDAVRAGTMGPWRVVRDVLGVVSPAEGGTAPSKKPEVSWYCRMLGDEFGPYTFRELKNLAAEGQLSPKDEIREGRSGPWRKASDERRIFKRRVTRHVGSDRATTSDSDRSDGDLLAGLEELEDAGADDLAFDFADLENADEAPSEAAPRTHRDPATAGSATGHVPPGDLASTHEMLRRLESEYRRLQAQIAGGPPTESPSWHGQPQWHGQPTAAPHAYPLPGFPAAPGAPPGWGFPSAPWPGAPQPVWTPAPQAPAPTAPPTPSVKLPPPPTKAAATSAPPSPRPQSVPVPPVARVEPIDVPPAEPRPSVPKPPSDSGGPTNAASVMRDMASAHLRAAQAPPRPSGRSSSGTNRGLSIDLSSIDFTSKPFIIGAAVVGVFLLGYFGMSLGLFSGMNAGPVYDETAKLYGEFKTASTGGPTSPAFSTFYTAFKPRHTALMGKLGSPSPGSTAHKVRQAVAYLGSTVEAMKQDLPKDDQAMYKDQLEQSLAQLKKEFGR